MLPLEGTQGLQAAAVTIQPDATANTLTHTALHTQARFPSSCSYTIPRDRVTEFILNMQLCSQQAQAVAQCFQ